MYLATLPSDRRVALYSTRFASLPLTSDPDLDGLQDRGIFEVEYLKKTTDLKYKVTIER